MPTKAIKIIKVNKTAKCATTLFSFLIPGVKIKKEIPKKVGIRAVVD